MKIGLVALFLVWSSVLMAQQFGGFPPSARWKQINTDTVRVIYTGGAEAAAARVATLIHRAAADTPFALGGKLRKVDVVLHSHTVFANGYVALAPFRSEFYLIPGSGIFDFGNLPWADNLAVHEYRHVQQYNNFRNGLAKGFYYLFGEQGLAFANGVAVPDWFFEGDAVHSETALTPQGRGRLSFFLSGYNSLWMEGRNYSWMKLRNGSMKDYVPDHYQLGYLLVNYGYLKYGDQFWKKVTHDASSFRGLFYPMQTAVKRYSGLSYRQFREEALDYYRNKLGNIKRTEINRKATVTHYYYPTYAGKDSVVYLQSAYNRIPAFYLNDGKKTTRIAQRFISSEEWFSLRNGTIAYTAYSTHPRWSLYDYSDIILLDIATKKEQRITSRKKYFTPDISPSGSNIIAVRMTDSLQTDLELLNRKDGSVLKVIRGDDDNYFVNPRFRNEDQVITGVRSAGSRMSLELIDLVTGIREILLPASYHTIGQPSVKGDTVYFTANFYGNDDLYALDIPGKKLFHLTSEITGTYFPSVLDSSLVYSLFTSNGLQLQGKNFRNVLWAEVPAAALNEQPLTYPVALSKEFLPVRTERFSSKRYDGGTGLFHFHSWSPNYADPEISFSVYSDNILNTFSNELYYRYNMNENSHAVGWNAAYGALFPVISTGLEYNMNRNLKTPSGELVLNELEARMGFNVPLNFSGGRSYKFLNAGTNIIFNHSMPAGPFKDSAGGSSAAYLHHFLSWSHYLPRALQHIYPKLGYTLALADRYYLDGKGSQFLGSAQLFLPSFGNHSIVLSGSYQKTIAFSNHGVLANRFAGARGYPDLYYPEMWRMSANYHFPILYPDIGAASIVYLQRLRGNIFYDASKNYGTAGNFIRDMNSMGAELYFDTKWWNQLPVSFGIRVSHLLNATPYNNKGDNVIEFIVPLSLIPQ